MGLLSFVQVSGEAASAAGAGVSAAADNAIYFSILLLIAGVIWLANKDVLSSRHRAKKTDRSLKNDRNALELRVSERASELVRAEEQRLIELQRNATFGELSRGLFHDLMNPLSALTLYAERMKGRPGLSDIEQDMVAKMISTSRRLKSYMDSVRRAIGSEKTEMPASDVRHEIEIAKDVLGYQARLAGVTMIIDQDEDIALPIHPVRLHQLLVNLMANAVEACGQKRKATRDYRDMDDPAENESGATVTICAKKNAGEVVMIVADTGTGISKENLGRLFKEPFTTKEKGTGIGLMTVKTIVEKELKGTISAESEEGKGARFVVKVSVSK